MFHIDFSTQTTTRSTTRARARLGDPSLIKRRAECRRTALEPTCIKENRRMVSPMHKCTKSDGSSFNRTSASRRSAALMLHARTARPTCAKMYHEGLAVCRQGYPLLVLSNNLRMTVQSTNPYANESVLCRNALRSSSDNGTRIWNEAV